MQEEEYRFKKGRLEDLGMMDYYDSLEHTHSFHQEGQIKAFLAKASPSTGKIDDESKNQTLNFQLVSSFKNLDKELKSELSKINDQYRQDFLRFNFIKLINANIELSGGLQKGTIELHSQIKKSKTEIELGLHYAQYFWSQYNREGNILDALTLTDLYRIGHSLLEINRRKLNKKFTELNLDETFDTFCGSYLERIIAQSFKGNTIEDFESGEFQIENVETFEQWKNLVQMLLDILPFAKNFYLRFKELKDSGQLSDHFYLNYDLSDIDLPALLLSSLSQFHLGNQLPEKPRLAVTKEEYLTVAKDFLNGNLTDSVSNFIKEYGLENVSRIESLINYFLKEAFEGVNFDEISEEEFKFVGGPLILA